MNRRQFLKLAGTAMMAPALPMPASEQTFRILGEPSDMIAVRLEDHDPDRLDQRARKMVSQVYWYCKQHDHRQVWWIEFCRTWPETKLGSHAIRITFDLSIQGKHKALTSERFFPSDWRWVDRIPLIEHKLWNDWIEAVEKEYWETITKSP